jgi:hypothetical protein
MIATSKFAVSPPYFVTVDANGALSFEAVFYGQLLLEKPIPFGQ